MSTLRALVWKESREIAPQAALLALLAVSWIALAALGGDASSRFPRELVAITLVVVALPTCALLLGATCAASASSDGFGFMRAASPRVVALVRLAVRLALLLATSALALGVATALGGTLGTEIASLGRERLTAGDVAPALVLGCLACAAASSAFFHRPLAAAMAGALAMVLLAACVGALGDTLARAEGLVPLVSTKAAVLGASNVLAVLLLALAAALSLLREGVEPVRPGALVRPALWTLAALGALLVLWTQGVDAWAKARLERLDARWSARWPVVTAPSRPPQSDAARSIHEAAAVLGLTDDWRGTSGPTLWERRHVAALLMPPAWDASGGMAVTLAALLPDLQAWIEAHPEPIAALREAASSGAIHWGPHPREAGAVPVDWPVVKDPARTLIADAIVQSSKGRTELATRDLDGAWALAESLLESPEEADLHEGLELRRLVAIAVRELDLPGEAWAQRLASPDLTPAVRDAVRRNLQRLVAASQAVDFMGGSSWYSRLPPSTTLADAHSVIWWLEQPALRWGAARSFERELAEAERLAAAAPCGPGSLARRPRAPAFEGPSLSCTYPSPTWVQLALTRVDCEMSAKVLQLRAARASDGAWPATLPGLETSSCEEAHWTWTLAPDGSGTLEFSETLRPLWGDAMARLAWNAPSPSRG